MSPDYLAHLRADTARFLEVLREAEPSLRVPSCPGWDVDDLLWHLGEVQWFWATIVDRRLQDPEPAEQDKPTRPGTHSGLVRFLEEAQAHLVEALSSADPAEPVWMWADDRTVGYVRRRQANEALIHRLDAELAVGAVTPLDPELAADALHEAFTTMFGGVPEWGTFTPTGRSVRIEPVDADPLTIRLGRFTGTSPDSGTTYDDPACEVTSDDAAADATVRGGVGDLAAWAWGRRDIADLTTDGDRAAVADLLAVLEEGVQ